MASASTVADVVNLALRRMGYKKRVSNLFDGSDAASQALDVFGQERDALIRDGDWQFASRSIVATLLKAAPANYFDTPWSPTTHPPLPWRFEYEYPTDCLKVRLVKPNGLLMFNPEPLWNNFAINNDNGSTPPRQTIVSNVEGAVLIYAGRVTNPSDWPVDFTEALALRLLNVLKPALMSDRTALDVATEAGITANAQTEQG